MMSSVLRTVFVYGTLKRGQPNYPLLCDSANGHASFLGSAHTKDCHPLVVASRYNLPFLLPVPGKGELVHGEVYAVDGAMLDHLDKLEDHPNLYQRSALQCVLLEEGRGQWAGRAAGEVVDSEAYFLTDYQEDLLQLPRLANYTSVSQGEGRYCAKHERDGGKEYYAEIKKQH